MNTFWIFAAVFCCFSQAISSDLGHMREESSSGDQHDISTADVVKEFSSSNGINPLSTLPSSCPTDSDFNEIHTIQVFGLKPFQVLCNADIAGPGWTVVAYRSSAELNFFRNWQDCKNGFGNLTGDFFIGLEKLHAITVSQRYELYIYLEDFEGNKRFARYDEFLIGTETDKYVMAKLGTYVGNAGDSLSLHRGMKFTTLDSDNDIDPTKNCAIDHAGPFWHYHCAAAHLFGLYLYGPFKDDMMFKGMFYYHWRGYFYSYKVMRMMVKPRH